MLTAPGLEPPVPFPAELNHDLVFVGGIAAATPNAAAAQAFVDFLKSPEAIAIFKAKGYIPTGIGAGNTGAGFPWEELSDTGGYAHLITAASQWLFYLEGKRDWEVQLGAGEVKGK